MCHSQESVCTTDWFLATTKEGRFVTVWYLSRNMEGWITLMKQCAIRCLLVLWFLGCSGHVFADGFPSQVLWATVKIIAPGSTATGFLVKSPSGQELVLVTAHHVFAAMKADECTILLHSRDESGKFAKNPQKLLVRKDAQPIWTKHPNSDAAAMVVSFGLDQNLAVLPWESLATAEELNQMELQPGDFVRSVGYPHGNMFKGNDLEFGIVRLGCLATFPFPPSEQARTFLLDTNIFEGDSGGPVYVWKLPSASGLDRADGGLERVIGLIVAQHFVDEQFTLIYQSGKFRHRMGLAIVVPSTVIRETVELALKRGESEQQPEEKKPETPSEAPGG